MQDQFAIEDQEVIKANLCLAGIICIFILLTLIAFLCTDGRSYFIIPLLRMCCPSCKWVVTYNDIETTDDKLLVLQLGMAHHVLGVKRPYRQV